MTVVTVRSYSRNSGRDLVGGRHVPARAPQQFGDQSLVGRLDVGVQQAHGHRGPTATCRPGRPLEPAPASQPARSLQLVQSVDQVGEFGGLERPARGVDPLHDAGPVGRG